MASGTGPPAAIVLLAAARFSADEDTMTVCAPARAKSAAISRPMPRLPPVTTASLLENSPDTIEPSVIAEPLETSFDVIKEGRLISHGRRLGDDMVAVVYHDGVFRFAATIRKEPWWGEAARMASRDPRRDRPHPH